MIVVIEKHNAHRHPKLMEGMFRLRARVFCDRLGWDVQVACGQERDKYDDEAPVYLIYADDEGREVKGSLRLLPTTGPTLLADLFSDTVPDAAHLSAPTIWECTRFCLDDRIVDKEQRLFASAVLIALWVMSRSEPGSNRLSPTLMPRCSGCTGASAARSRSSVRRRGTVGRSIWDCLRFPSRFCTGSKQECWRLVSPLRGREKRALRNP